MYHSDTCWNIVQLFWYMMDWFPLMNWKQEGLQNDRKLTNCVVVILRELCKYDFIAKAHVLALFSGGNI